MENATTEHYKKMTPKQRMFNKDYLEKSLQVPDGKVGQMKWMWPYWQESLLILTRVMTELNELPTISQQHSITVSQ